MNQTCKVCGEPAAGFHFGAFTCEGCKSFFGRSYNNLSSVSECKNNGKCIIDKKNRTTCKACRLRKCYTVGMSKGGSRYGRRSNWFKIHCLLQEQQQQAAEAVGKAAAAGSPTAGFGDMAAAVAVAQRNSHLAAAQHMGGLLGYPSYHHLPEMMHSASPFMSAAAAAAVRHPSDAAAAAAALPFFNMMNSLPMGPHHPQSTFQLPPHLLFPGYPASNAADATYRAEMYKHRQSVDSAASGESSTQRYSPAAVAVHSPHSAAAADAVVMARVPAPPSPELCVSGDDDEEEHIHSATQSVLSHHSTPSPISSAMPTMHTIHSPIAIRATPNNKTLSPVPSHTSRATQPRTPSAAPTTLTPLTTPSPSAVATADQATLSFTSKMQSLSPVSVCSITAETTVTHVTASQGEGVANDQDCPMDLSMKVSRSSVHSFNTSAGESDAQSDFSEEELQRQSQNQAVRRKFYQLEGSNSEHETDSASSDMSGADETVKRQKIAAEMSVTPNYGSFAHSARGIFVCV